MEGGAAQAAGGSSGGGSINIFANIIREAGTVSANGGASVSSGGGKGGNGSVNIDELQPYLNYPQKEINIEKDTSYEIDDTKFAYINQNGIQTPIVNMGTLKYESLDTNIVTVDNKGRIVGIKVGKAKIKITDTTNNISTYIYINVYNGSRIDVQEGKNFTIALKENGTVWSYGKNDKGQLGTGDNNNQNEPIQIQNLVDIKQISVGYSHSLALSKTGDIYCWGFGEKGQLGNGNAVNSSNPVIVTGITDIKKVQAYKNISLALDNNGIVYVWGEGYANLPIKLVFTERITDISGRLMLTNEGKIYDISDLNNPVRNLKDISKISCGEDHVAALSSNGMLYLWGDNKYGQCANKKVDNKNSQTVDFKVIDISAGNGTTIIQSENKEVYVIGNNNNGQIGLKETASTYKIEKMDVGTEIENISAGIGTHSGLVDKNGYVWHTGTNANGELGIGNNENTTEFIKNGQSVVRTNFEKKYLEIGEKETVIARLENTFNLKIDLVDDNQENFYLDLGEKQIIDIEELTMTAINYGTSNIKVIHKDTKKEKEITIIVSMKMESIIQGFRDYDCTDRRICSSGKRPAIYSRSNKYIWRHKIFFRRRPKRENNIFGR